MKKKYILTPITIIHKGHILHRVQAVRSFGDVKEGDLGGFVESENNLSHDGNCWIFDNAIAYEKSRILQNARIYNRVHVSEYAIIRDCATIYNSVKVLGHATIEGNASIINSATICGKSFVSGRSCISGRAIISGTPHIYDNAAISDSTLIYSDAVIGGKIEIYENARIIGFSKTGSKDRMRLFGAARIGNNAKIQSANDFLSIGPLGSRYDTTTFYRAVDNDIWVACGCFNWSIDVFKEAVKLRHRGTRYFNGYMRAIRYAKKVLG